MDKIFGWDYPPGCNGTPYDEENFEQEYEKLEDALKELDNGRNTECWNLVSFGWKDADLDPEGCCGISEIVNITDEMVTVEVGGHKTLGDPTYECEWELSEDDAVEYSDMAFEIVAACKYPGDWTGSDWCLYMEKEYVKAPWIFDVDGNINYMLTAENIIEQAREAVKGFQNEMKHLDNAIEELFQQLRQKYERRDHGNHGEF